MVQAVVHPAWLLVRVPDIRAINPIHRFTLSMPSHNLMHAHIRPPEIADIKPMGITNAKYWQG
jgi:hypothetical protein